MISRRALLTALGVPVVLAALPRFAFAQEDGFYANGRTIDLIVPASPGAGADVAARYLATYLNKYIEGAPPVRIQNVAGGAAMLGANQFAIGRHDGYSTLMASSSVWVNYLLGNENAQYDLSKIVPIVGIPGNSILSIAPSTGYKTAKDILNPAEPLAMGAGDPAGGHIRLIIALELLKIADSVQMVFGYEGGGATRVAFEQGEINLCSQTTPGYLTNMVPLEEEGKSIPLFQIGVLDDSNDFVRDPLLPDVQTVRELYVDIYGQEPAGPLYDALKVFGGVVNAMQIALVIHDDAPEGAITALREAAEKMAVDPDFLSNAQEALGSDNVIVGAPLDTIMETVRTLQNETLIEIRKLATEKYGAKGLRY
jgi:tripartite-type tricarboxylate transporter receptor subunit TctC